MSVTEYFAKCGEYVQTCCVKVWERSKVEINITNPHEPRFNCCECYCEQTCLVGCTTNSDDKEDRVYVCCFFPPELCYPLGVIISIFLTPILLVLYYLKIYVIPTILILFNIFANTCPLQKSSFDRARDLIFTPSET